MKKPIASLMMLSIMICSIGMISTTQSVKAQTGTQVGGILSNNAAWTLANSPYDLTANLLIPQNLTLIIEAGTEINLNGHFIQVDGVLQALGTAQQRIKIADSVNTCYGKIVFTPLSAAWNESAQTGNIIRYTNIESEDYSDTGGIIRVDGGAPEIANDYLVNTNPSGSALTITGGTPSISSCIIRGYNGILVWQGAPKIYNNLIIGSSSSQYIGIFLISNLTDTTYIENNLVLNYEIGINLGASGCPAIITKNCITCNRIGIGLSYSYNQIYDNNIYGNKEWNVGIGFDNVNMPHNWWGTIDVQTISQTINDFKNDYRLGNATFSPYLATPNMDSPTYVNASNSMGGSISNRGIMKLNYGDSPTFTMTPDSGYHVSDVLVNGKSVGAVSSYTIQNIAGATSIYAIFAVNPTLTTTPNPAQTPISNPTTNPTGEPAANPSTNPTTSSTPTATPLIPTESPTEEPTVDPTSDDLIVLPEDSDQTFDSTKVFYAIIIFSVVAILIILVLKSKKI